MRSLIILEVEHGEDTDLLDAWIAHILYAVRKGDGEYAGTLNGYTVKVDLPACFVLDSENTN